MNSPIDSLIDRASLKCTICSAPAGTCSCWTKCRCGISYPAGGECRNPDHQLEKVCEELASGLASQVLHEIRHAYPEPMKHASGGFQKTLKALIKRHAKATLMDVYKAIDDVPQSHG